MRCNNCGDEVSENDARWYDDDPYCYECFSDQFNYCCDCDTVISNGETHYDSGNPYCIDCYENQTDYDAPDNPPVDESDRKHIVTISRDWLNDKMKYKRPISINGKDFHLKEIKEKVGTVDRKIYVFGLIDRDDHHISASSDILGYVKDYVKVYFPKAKVWQGSGSSRLGICRSLRDNNLEEIVELIKHIATIKELVTS